MQRTDLLEFEPGRGRWSRDADGYEFTGIGVSGPVRFVITAEALRELVNPGGEAVDGELGVSIFEQFDHDIFHIAQREVSRRGTEHQPIILTRDDMG
ncbi:hypothetical protein [Sphingomonas sp. CARO-RG-8B-R24-01]|uniref:hypothetical protein n=1 Tax=Sphingomonas sp. CARO-RG-8B-R24-01 TaxID=2914831 RepID=UPI001F573C7B|nr:hypothetical protein [Sphingomonas sp. CARO-RG-8B-R24-01]